MKKLLFALCLSMLFLPSYAQSPNDIPANSGFGLKAGWTETWIADQHASPLLYQSDVMNIGALYQQSGSGRFLFEVALTLKIGTNQARRFSQRTTHVPSTPDIYGQKELDEVNANPFLSMLAGDLNIRALWGLSSHHQLGLSFNARHIYTAISLDDWHYTQVDLSPEYRYSRRLGQGDVQANFSLPLLAGVVRPNYAFDPSLPDLTNYYKGYLRTGARLTSVNRLFNPRVRAGYTWHFNNGKSLGASYFAAWTSYPEPRPLRIFENGVDLHYFF